MKALMRDKFTDVYYLQEQVAEVCTLKAARENSECGISSICSKEEDWNHILRYIETNISRDKILAKRFNHIVRCMCVTMDEG
jgi:hypothetical protein